MAQKIINTVMAVGAFFIYLSNFAPSFLVSWSIQPETSPFFVFISGQPQTPLYISLTSLIAPLLYLSFKAFLVIKACTLRQKKNQERLES